MLEIEGAMRGVICIEFEYTDPAVLAIRVSTCYTSLHDDLKGAFTCIRGGKRLPSILLMCRVDGTAEASISCQDIRDFGRS